jgi:hypothetical protein
MRIRIVALALVIALGLAVVAAQALSVTATHRLPATHVRSLARAPASASTVSGGPVTDPLPPPPVPTCTAQQLSGSFAFVFGSNATGHVLYTLTITNTSTSTGCMFHVPFDLALLRRGGGSVPTTPSFATAPYTVQLAAGQSAQTTAELSPDLFGPGEPSHGNCEPVARALRITIGGSSVLAPMDPTPVCQHGALSFNYIKPVPQTPACSAGSLSATFKREEPMFSGFTIYDLRLHNTSGQACHASNVVGLQLLGAGAGKLGTVVHAGVSGLYVIDGHSTQTAIAKLSTRRAAGGCDAVAQRIAITPNPGATAITAPIRPPVSVCRGGLIELSGLFRNG